MSVTKATCERYTVRNGYDAATICIYEWAPRSDSHGPIYGGEILVNSSFGSYCNTWSHCGMPFKRFLAGLDFDYFMGKCLGLEAKEYDGDTTVRRVKEKILEDRRDGGLGREGARELWDALDWHWQDIRDSEYGLRDAASNTELGKVLGGEWYEYISKRPTAQSKGFWRDIWPVFLKAIREETTKQLHEELNNGD